MSIALIKQCPQCEKPFQASRKNQDYCSTQCRHDHNNELAKARYTTFKKEAPKIGALQQELKQLKEYLASLTIVIEGVHEINTKTIRYQGRFYQREAKLGRLELGISLGQGGGIQLPGNQIIYRSLHSQSADNCWRYTMAN